MQANSHQAHVEAAKVAQLEAAQAAAQEALMQEMELLRRQKHGAEQHARDLEEQVSNVPPAHSVLFACLATWLSAAISIRWNAAGRAQAWNMLHPALTCT